MKKEYSISLIRTMALFMIIACHILQGLNNRLAFYVNVGVQIFFFISGYLYGKKKISDPSRFYKKQFIKILQPYIIVLFSILFVDVVIFNVPLISLKTILGNILGLGAFAGTHKVLTHTWFVTYILLCYLITPLLSNYLDLSNKKQIDIFKIIFILFVIALLVNLFGVVNFNAFWIVNYILGYIFSMYYVKNGYGYKKILDLTLIVIVLLLPFRMYIESNLLDSTNFLILKFCDFYHVILGCGIFLSLHRIFNKTNFSLKSRKVLDFFDKYSYFIYLVHQIFILNKYSYLFITDYLILNIIFIIFSSIFWGVCLFKVNNVTTKLIDLSYKKINWRNKDEKEN